VVNETMARRLYPDVPPLGRRFSLNNRDFEIVGVVKDAKYTSLREKPKGMFFLNMEQRPDPDSFQNLVVRVTGKPETLIPQIRAAIRGEAPNLPISEMTTLGEEVDRSLGREKLLAR